MSEEFATPAQSEDSAEIGSAPASPPADSSADSPAEESAGATVKVGLEILGGRTPLFVGRAKKNACVPTRASWNDGLSPSAGKPTMQMPRGFDCRRLTTSR